MHVNERSQPVVYITAREGVCGSDNYEHEQQEQFTAQYYPISALNQPTRKDCDSPAAGLQ